MSDLNIIVPTVSQTVVTEPHRPAEEGGEEMGAFKAAAKLIGFAAKPAASLDKQIKTIIGQLQDVMNAIQASPIGDLRLNGVEVQLAVSAEGTIGIATAGVEASITLSFERS